MEMTELHPWLRDLMLVELNYEGLEVWFNVVADWLSLECPLGRDGVGLVEPTMLRWALQYRIFWEALEFQSFPRELPDTESYPYLLLSDFVRTDSIADEEVFKLGQYLAGLLDSND